MLKLDELVFSLEKIAPLSISEKMIAAGEYDNSGIIIRAHENVNKILFCLDLSDKSVNRAKRVGADTVVTHHPAIYYPIKNLSYIDKTTSPVLSAAANGMNVVSMHLNLDAAEKGIDYYLMKGLGGEKYKILDYLDETHGYGREFSVNKVAFSTYVAGIKRTFNSKKIIAYGKKNDLVNMVASFCGGGYDHALAMVKKRVTDADVIISSDMPHHVLKELTEYGKKVVIIPHYVSECYGFNEFYKSVSADINNKVESVFFDDKRFR